VSSSRINVTWTDGSDNEEGFELEWSPDGVTSSLRATLWADATNFADTPLQPGTTRHYRVRAFNAGGTSSWSNTGSATTP
jgi:titin